MTTRAQLASAVDSWLIRDDVSGSSDFSLILKMAESRLNRVTRTVIQEQSVDLTFTGRSADLPADYLEWRQVFIDDNVRKMDYKTPKALRESSAWVNGRAGRSFTIEGGGGTAGLDDRYQMVIAGPASVASPLTVEMLYWAKWGVLTDPADTNWLLTNHFDVYLYATLRAAAEYIEESEKEVKYETRFQTALKELHDSAGRGRFGAGPFHSSGSPRAVV